MRLLSWNIRAGGGKRIAEIFKQIQAWQPDIIGLSEFRGTLASQWLASSLKEVGYSHQLRTVDPARLATNALLLAARQPLVSLTIPTMPQNPTRWLLAQLVTEPPLVLGLMHLPNYTTPESKYPYLNAILDMISEWHHGPALLFGDTNSGKMGIDEETTTGTVFRREHAWMVGMEERGWLDTFRFLHGDRREYTWYSHRNNGFRLDQAFCSPTLIPAVTEVRHLWGHNPRQPERRDGLSDHAALIVDLDLTKVLQG